jgi:hypothetical protein
VVRAGTPLDKIPRLIFGLMTVTYIVSKLPLAYTPTDGLGMMPI